MIIFKTNSLLKTFISIFFIVNTLNVYSQKAKKYYINSKGDKTTKGFAKYKREVLKKDDVFFVKEYYLNGLLKMEGSYNDKSFEKRNGTFKFYYLNGNISSIIEYENGNRHGVAKKYFITGKLSKSINYTMGKLSGSWTYYNEEGKIDCEIENATSNKVKELYRSAIFDGGKKAINEYFRKVGSQLSILGGELYGQTYASFKVDETGDVSDVDIILHGTIEMDSIIIKHILKMPKWKPALENGKPTSYRYYVPFRFSSNSKKGSISDDKIAKGFFTSGVKDYKEGKFEEAVYKFEKAVKFNTMEAKYHYYLAHGYYQTKKKDFACEYWRIVDILDDKILEKEDAIKNLCNLE
jgi:antitoxin component YwqK of YwqJK toxin-antitoxin module